ncbi:hypothetical protein Goshw_004278 [Gossypium schwendimanii]|uniref:Uncharacterized protein n=1 Tax=Gossypium schwendimanii TaxID=34291 RepID=A0A7J9MR45_GOSSC|nr:hypothetical protein [Gossypium schwendimanii]
MDGGNAYQTHMSAEEDSVLLYLGYLGQYIITWLASRKGALVATGGQYNKINFDEVFDSQRQLSGSSIISRNSKVMCLGTRIWTNSHVASPFAVEALAFL